VGTFAVCTNLITVVIPDSVTSIEDLAFYACPNLRTIYFMGNAPSLNAPILGDSWIFHYDSNATAYYLQGTTGWAEFSSETGLPTVMITKPGRHKHHEEHKYFR
jgi:hypothetical protein